MGVSGAARYGTPGGRTAGGPARAQYVEADPTVSPTILGENEAEAVRTPPVTA